VRGKQQPTPKAIALLERLRSPSHHKKVTKDYYLMSFQTLASIDLNVCTKAQLKAFVKLARDEWGRSISDPLT
jgi:hypothetical protein